MYHSYNTAVFGVINDLNSWGLDSTGDDEPARSAVWGKSGPGYCGGYPNRRQGNGEWASKDRDGA